MVCRRLILDTIKVVRKSAREYYFVWKIVLSTACFSKIGDIEHVILQQRFAKVPTQELCSVKHFPQRITKTRKQKKITLNTLLCRNISQRCENRERFFLCSYPWPPKESLSICFFFYISFPRKTSTVSRRQQIKIGKFLWCILGVLKLE